MRYRPGESTIPAFEKTCWKCGTKFLYISDAIKHDKDGDYVICPSCGAFISHQETPKTADFIPPKCTSDAKGEDRSQKHSDSITTLEEAAEDGARQNYVAGGYSPFPNIEYGAYKKGFIAGAEWQKEQMLKDAVEGKVLELGEIFNDLTLSVEGKELNEVLQSLGVKEGDRVRVVIVKEGKI